VKWVLPIKPVESDQVKKLARVFKTIQQPLHVNLSSPTTFCKKSTVQITRSLLSLHYMRECVKLGKFLTLDINEKFPLTNV